jgi:hypothetical protein
MSSMTSIALTWLSTAALLAITVVVFVVLAEWSAGGPAPWSIVPGVTRGVRDWIHRQEELEPLHLVSPRAEEPPPEMDSMALPLPPLHPEGPEPEAWVEEQVDDEILAEVEVEDLAKRRI